MDGWVIRTTRVEEQMMGDEIMEYVHERLRTESKLRNMASAFSRESSPAGRSTSVEAVGVVLPGEEKKGVVLKHRGTSPFRGEDQPKGKDHVNRPSSPRSPREKGRRMNNVPPWGYQCKGANDCGAQNQQKVWECQEPHDA